MGRCLGFAPFCLISKLLVEIEAESMCRHREVVAAPSMGIGFVVPPLLSVSHLPIQVFQSSRVSYCSRLLRLRLGIVATGYFHGYNI